MASDDPKRFREITKPRKAPTPGSELPKKPEKKLEPTVMVAIISAVVTIFTAILSSPLLLSLVNKSPETAPSVAEMGASNSSMPEATASEDGLANAVDKLEPPTSTEILSPTALPSTLLPPTALVTLEVSPTPLPPTEEETTSENLPLVPSLLNCFAVDVWFPFPTTLNPPVEDGCWDLASWGFSTGPDQLSLIHTPAVDEQRGVFLPLTGNVMIQFTFQLNEFRSHSNKGGFLHFGIVQDDPFDNYKGGYLSYQQPSPGATSPIRVLVSGSGQATQTLLTLEKGFQQTVQFTVDGDWLTVYLDGSPAGEPVKLPSTKRAFWIGYILPGKAELDVTLTDFSVQTP